MLKLSYILPGAAAVVLSAGVACADNIVRIASPYKVTSLDPISAAAAGNIEAYGQLYTHLLRQNADGSLEPGLAESWTISDDKLVYQFELRDAKFSDGSTITAEDVAFSLTRAGGENSAYPAPFASISEVKAVDEDTVQIILTKPSAPLLAYTAIFNAGIVSKDDVEARGEDAFDANAVTSGPFTVQDWKPNDRLTLKANPHYWREGYPKIAGVDLIEVTDNNARSTMMLAGEIDVSRDVPWPQVDELNAADNISIPLDESTVIVILLPNHTAAPFDNLNIRKAAAMALNREAVAKVATQGRAQVANSTLPNALSYYAEDVQPPAYDPDGARALLEAEDAVGTEIELLIVPGRQELATLYKAQWDAVGFNTIVEVVDGGLWWDRVLGGEYQVTATWWYNETEDPDLAVRWALCGTCGNRSYYTNYNNERINELTDAALHEQDEEKRAAMYHEIQRISVDELAQIPIYYPPHPNAYSSRISGLTLTPSLQWTLEETEIVGD
ncbi:ABC transporter substrate-binding protein [Ruegeria sp.]|uniref:ABC transporter substrate-binding protein n=1 Tax=Ruegeria sp. TaxID=1879320 RepID=UPI00230FB5D2|nr:ABC transporter substrate-binding protein [Ruegeria sp.]MDA7966840.1 ABC transporter substrate-binding protein [Ruegeria sp.]